MSDNCDGVVVDQHIALDIDDLNKYDIDNCYNPKQNILPYDYNPYDHNPYDHNPYNYSPYD